MKELTKKYGIRVIKNKNFKQFFASFFLMALGALLHFFMHSQISSFFGVRNYGYFSFFMALTAFFFPIATWGFSASAVNILPTITNAKVRKEFIFLGLLITLSSIGVLAVVLLLLKFTGVLDGYNNYIIFLVLFPLIAITRYFQQVFRGLKESISSLLPEQILLPIIVLVGIYFISPDIISLVLIMVIGWTIATIYSIFKVKKHLFFNRTTKERRDKWIKRSMMMIAGTLASIFLFRTDIILIGVFMQPENVGVYNACLKIAMLIIFPLGALNNIGISILAERFKSGHSEFRKYFDRLQLASVAMMLVSCFILITLKNTFFDLFKIDVKYTYILYILVAGQIINGMSGPVGYAMNILNKEKLRFLIVVIACIVGIISNLIFIPMYGLLGAAVTTAIIMTVQNSVMYYYARIKV